jgi:hypothetical protein
VERLHCRPGRAWSARGAVARARSVSAGTRRGRGGTTTRSVSGGLVTWCEIASNVIGANRACEFVAVVATNFVRCLVERFRGLGARDSVDEIYDADAF